MLSAAVVAVALNINLNLFQRETIGIENEIWSFVFLGRNLKNIPLSFVIHSFSQELAEGCKTIGLD